MNQPFCRFFLFFFPNILFFSNILFLFYVLTYFRLYALSLVGLWMRTCIYAFNSRSSLENENLIFSLRMKRLGVSTIVDMRNAKKLRGGKLCVSSIAERTYYSFYFYFIELDKPISK